MPACVALRHDQQQNGPRPDIANVEECCIDASGKRCLRNRLRANVLYLADGCGFIPDKERVRLEQQLRSRVWIMSHLG